MWSSIGKMEYYMICGELFYVRSIFPILCSSNWLQWAVYKSRKKLWSCICDHAVKSTTWGAHPLFLLLFCRVPRLVHITPVVRHCNWKGFARRAVYLQAHVAPPKAVLATVRQPMSTASTQQQSLLAKARNYLDKDPFIKVSLVFVGVVFAMSLVIEVYLKLQKRKKETKMRSTAIFPPRPSTAIAYRTGMLSHLAQLVTDQQRHSLPSAILLVGPAGSGKTELLRQHAEQFAINHRSRSTEKRAQVIVVDANSLDSLELSLMHGLHILGFSYLHTAEHLKSSEPATFAMKCQNLLHLLVAEICSCTRPCLLIIDNVTEETLPCCESAFQQNCDTLQVVAASSSAMTSMRMKGFDVPVLDLSSGCVVNVVRI